jgi:hypothetical protein
MNQTSKEDSFDISRRNELNEQVFCFLTQFNALWLVYASRVLGEPDKAIKIWSTTTLPLQDADNFYLEPFGKFPRYQPRSKLERSEHVAL